MGAVGFAGLGLRRELQKVLDELLSVAGEDAFGVELDTLDRQAAMAEAHDRGGAVGVAGACGDLEFGGQRVFGHDQGVIPGAGHWTGDAGEHGLAVMLDAAGLAMHQLRGADDVASKGRSDGLMAEADAENRGLAGEALDERNEDAGILWCARAGRKDEAFGREGLDLVDGELVVATDDHLRAELAHVLHKVVGEGIVVVEYEDHGLLIV